MFELFARRAYHSVPDSLRQLCRIAPYSLAVGRRYRRTLRLCSASDRWSREEVTAHQKRMLGNLLQFAVEQVPYYRRYRSLVNRCEPYEAWRQFPRISKSILRERFQEFVPQCIDRIPHRIAHTSGSSGQLLAFLEDASSYAREMAHIHAQWRRVGYAPRCRKATFRDIVLGESKPDVFWRMNPIHNELQFSPFHLNESNLRICVQKIVEYRPQFLHGYPSAIDVVAEYVERHHLEDRLPPILAALLCGEGCSSHQRERIARALRTRVYTWYGHSERTVLAGECEHSRCYHAFPTYGLAEILAADGSPCGVGEEGEIVGTGLLNRSMPLIRYRTDDYAVRREPCGKCSRAWDCFSEVRGRRDCEGYVIGKSGVRVSAATLETPSSVFCNVVRFQYHQRKAGELRIRIVPNPGFSPDDETRILAAHKSRLRDEMTIVVERVAEIPLTTTGKQRWIISEIPWSAGMMETEPSPSSGGEPRMLHM